MTEALDETNFDCDPINDAEDADGDVYVTALRRDTNRLVVKFHHDPFAYNNSSPVSDISVEYEARAKAWTSYFSQSLCQKDVEY